MSSSVAGYVSSSAWRNALWPVVPSAGFFGGDAWLKIHEAHVKTVQENKGPVDVLLVGDSITIQWGEAWKQHFPNLKVVNIGIGGSDLGPRVVWDALRPLDPAIDLRFVANIDPRDMAEALIKAHDFFS